MLLMCCYYIHVSNSGISPDHWQAAEKGGIIMAKIKLYHGTRIDVVEMILANGIEPWTTEASSHIPDDDRLLRPGIFAFDNIDDATSFARDLCESSGIAVFSFEVDEDDVLVDPEYDGESYFYPTECNVKATLEYAERYR
jgi:hypothetical protein